MKAPVLLLILGLAGSVPRLAICACPSNTITAGETHTSDASRDSLSFDYSRCESEPSFCYGFSGTSVYDLVSGSAHVIASGDQAAGTASCMTHDIFTLTGPSGAPPITFIVRLHAHIYADNQPSHGTVSLCEGATNCDSVSNNSPFSSLDRDLEFVVTRSASQTLDLYMRLSAVGGDYGSSGFAYAGAQISFPNLPSGFAVTSCQGFVSSQTVPTQRASWGRLKSMYR